MADQLLTGGEGELAEHCHPALRRNVAIFASGKVFVAQGRENDDGVSSVIALAERMGYRLDSEIKLVDRGVIERFYSTSRTVRGSDGNSSDDPESMRHAVYEVLDRASTMDGAGDVIIKRNGDVSRAYVMLDGVQRPLLEDEWSADYGGKFIRAAYAWAGKLGEGSAERGYTEGAHQVGQISKGLPKKLQSVRLQKLSTAFGGEELIMRLMPTPAKSGVRLEDLGFDQADLGRFTEMMYMADGLVIVTGPTGSGKTHTLHGLMNLSLSLFPGDRWITVEDPVEIPVYRDEVTLMDVVGSGSGDDVDTGYEDALEASLRSIPRRLMFGEIRSRGSASLAVTAALTGHAVLTTLHTDSALGAVPRLLDLGVSKEMLRDQDVLRGLTAQRLFRRLCDCARTVTRKEWAGYCPQWLEEIFTEAGHVKVANREGCPNCFEGHIRGRTPLTEIVRPTPAILDALINGNRHMAREVWVKEGGRPLADQAVALVSSGNLDPNEVMRCINVSGVRHVIS